MSRDQLWQIETYRDDTDTDPHHAEWYVWGPAFEPDRCTGSAAHLWHARVAVPDAVRLLARTLAAGVGMHAVRYGLAEHLEVGDDVPALRSPLPASVQWVAVDTLPRHLPAGDLP